MELGTNKKLFEVDINQDYANPKINGKEIENNLVKARNWEKRRRMPPLYSEDLKNKNEIYRRKMGLEEPRNREDVLSDVQTTKEKMESAQRNFDEKFQEKQKLRNEVGDDELIDFNKTELRPARNELTKAKLNHDNALSEAEEQKVAFDLMGLNGPRYSE